MYKELLEYIVKNLVSSPDKIEISENENEGKTVLKLKVAKDDMGRIIGKEGRIIRSIREIIYLLMLKNKRRTLNVKCFNWTDSKCTWY